VAKFGDRWERVSDDRVTVQETQDNLCNGKVAEEKDAEVKTLIEILDNNGDADTGYDIEKIHVGDTCRFANLNQVTSKTYGDNMQIVSITRSLDKVTCELESIRTNVSRSISAISKKLQEQLLNTGATGNGGGFKTGDVKMSLNSTPDTGFLLFNGQTVSRTTYSGLWAWVQANSMIKAGGFTVGDGSTTFGLPNVVDRVPRATITNGQALDQGGSDTVNLQHRHYHAHTHGLGGHTHGNTGYISSDHSHNANHGHSGGASHQGSYVLSGSDTNASYYAASRYVGHNFTVDGNNFNTSGVSANHYHGTGGPSGGSDGASDSYTNYQLATNVSIINPYFKLFYFVKY